VILPQAQLKAVGIPFSDDDPDYPDSDAEILWSQWFLDEIFD
jgi:hypothetical protein